ncbi:hypothetical protein SUGI_0575530 [Cryptomeria japonica]|uniref:cyclin-D2-1 n=1 Tax=Cryptomeria japonica TaxID=3369 RepID=UPI002408E242|nr:cyclin-D2-1 [Cryptomeria japonica]GLJ29185.1 hypothetical protein SUGI_0575530 [Cryptomeria japonica]
MALSFDCLSSLLCAEDGGWDDEVASSSFPEDKVETLKCIELAGLPDFPVEDDEMVSFLVQKEKEHLPREDYVERYRNRALDVTARREAISWMHKVQEHHNFRPLTLYLSVNYLDRFLSIYQLPQGLGWPLQLLSVACLSLAAKMEETEVPSLTDLQVGDAKFVFEARTIYRMEVLILTTLKWRLCSITPFNFIDYLLYRLKGTSAVPHDLISRTIAFIINTNRAIDFLVHQPSSIAAAAVMCACEEVLPTESADYKEAILSSKAINQEKIINCYNLMQQLVMDFCSTPNKISSGTPHSPIGVLDAAACISSESTQNTSSSKKRKISQGRLGRAADQRW